MNPNTSTNGLIGSTASHAIASIQGHPEGAAMDASVKAWAHDPMVLPWDSWWDGYWRRKRRPRCGEIGGNDGR